MTNACKYLAIVLGAVALLLSTRTSGADNDDLSELPPIPRTRDGAEPFQNWSRRRPQQGGFQDRADYELGVRVRYGEGGVTVVAVQPESPAEKVGIVVGDWILEVDGVPVGLIRKREYPLWPRYALGKSPGRVELMIASQVGSGWRYWYPIVDLAPISAYRKEALKTAPDGGG